MRNYFASLKAELLPVRFPPVRGRTPTGRTQTGESQMAEEEDLNNRIKANLSNIVLDSSVPEGDKDNSLG